MNDLDIYLANMEVGRRWIEGGRKQKLEVKCIEDHGYYLFQGDLPLFSTIDSLWRLKEYKAGDRFRHIRDGSIWVLNQVALCDKWVLIELENGVIYSSIACNTPEEAFGGNRKFFEEM